MVAQWRAQLPEGTPNYFLINITQSEKPEIEQHFANANVEMSDFYPVVRGRFVAVNDERVNTSMSKEDEEGPREGRDGLGREANLTWSNTLQFGNEITAGNWQGDDTSEPEDGIYPVSVEEQRLTQLYGRQGVEAVITELSRF